MTVLRKQHKSKFTTIDNELLVDHRLSFRARGVATYLLSKPDDWRVNLKDIVQSGVEGREAIRTAIRELATLGYLMRDKENQGDGTIRTITVVADYPAFAHIGTPDTRFIGYGDEDGDDRPTGNPSDGSPVDVVNTELPNNTTYVAMQPVVQEELFHVEPEPVPPRDVDHPAVKAYYEVHGRNPNKAQMRLIVERNPPLDAWKRALRAWLGRDYKPTNIDGPLEWAENPQAMERRSKAQIKKDPTDGATWQEMFDAQEENDGSYKGPAYVLPDGYME